MSVPASTEFTAFMMNVSTMMCGVCWYVYVHVCVCVGACVCVCVSACVCVCVLGVPCVYIM